MAQREDSAASAGDAGSTLGREDPLEKKMATYSSILAWKISWTEEPDGLQSMGLQRVGKDLATEQQQQHFPIQLCGIGLYIIF